MTCVVSSCSGRCDTRNRGYGYQSFGSDMSMMIDQDVNKHTLRPFFQILPHVQPVDYW